MCVCVSVCFCDVIPGVLSWVCVHHLESRERRGTVLHHHAQCVCVCMCVCEGRISMGSTHSEVQEKLFLQEKGCSKVAIAT